MGGMTRTDVLNYSVKADRNGQYEISGVDVQQLFIANAYDANKELRIQKVLGYLPANQVTTWDIHMWKPIIVRGAVRGMRSQQAITTPRILRISVVQDGKGVASVGGRPGTIPNGVYELPVPSGPGRFLVVPTYQPYSFHGFESYGREVTLSEGAVQTVDLELPDPFEMSIRVVDDNGAPIKDAHVGQEGGGVSGQIGSTDAAGRFAFNGFMPEMENVSTSESWFEVSAPGRFSGESAHHLGAPGQVFPEETIVLYPAGEAAGKLSAANGDVVANQKIAVKATYGTIVDRTLEIVTDSKGAFRMKIPATSLTLDAAPNPSRPLESFRIAGIQCAPGQTVDLGDVSFEER